jgi:tetratricopeptide (TPR) repeat protein
MTKKTLAVSAALLLGLAGCVSLLSPVPAQAAGKLEIKDKALFQAYTEAQAADRAKDYKEALAKAKEADAMSGKPAQLVPIIHEMIVNYAIQAKDYNTALGEIDKMIAAGEGNKLQLTRQALSISVQTGNKAKMNEYASQLGTNLDPATRLYIAGSMMNAGQYKEALAEADPLLKESKPSEDALKFEQLVYFKMHDTAGRRAALERLVSFYPKPEYWHDLLQIVRNERGLGDEQVMDIYRLRLAVGDLKSQQDYEEMAQQALIVGYPGEAKAVLEKATAAKVLSGERDARMVRMANDNVSKDSAVQDELRKKADSDPESALKLGLILWSYGKNADAEKYIRSAMKGTLSDPDEAKVALGHVLFSAGKKAEAVKAFNSVGKSSKEASVARLWSIYARGG